jgi:hypothetical protein
LDKARCSYIPAKLKCEFSFVKTPASLSSTRWRDSQCPRWVSLRSTHPTDLRAEFHVERLAQVLQVIAAGRLDASLGLTSTPEREALLHLSRGAASFVLKVFARKRRINQRFPK